MIKRVVELNGVKFSTGTSEGEIAVYRGFVIYKPVLKRTMSMDEHDKLRHSVIMFKKVNCANIYKYNKYDSDMYFADNRDCTYDDMVPAVMILDKSEELIIHSVYDAIDTYIETGKFGLTGTLKEDYYLVDGTGDVEI